jgi:hypothetical protein
MRVPVAGRAVDFAQILAVPPAASCSLIQLLDGFDTLFGIAVNELNATRCHSERGL